jgi:hypothetical protein
LERLELIAGTTGTISSEGRARGGNVAPLPDNLSPKPNSVNETRVDLDLDKHSRPITITAKFPTGVSYAGLQSKSDEDFRHV